MTQIDDVESLKSPEELLEDLSDAIAVLRSKAARPKVKLEECARALFLHVMRDADPVDVLPFSVRKQEYIGYAKAVLDKAGLVQGVDYE